MGYWGHMQQKKKPQTSQKTEPSKHTVPQTPEDTTEARRNMWLPTMSSHYRLRSGHVISTLIKSLPSLPSTGFLQKTYSLHAPCKDNWLREGTSSYLSEICSKQSFNYCHVHIHTWKLFLQTDTDVLQEFKPRSLQSQFVVMSSHCPLLFFLF